MHSFTVRLGGGNYGISLVQRQRIELESWLIHLGVVPPAPP